MSAWVHTASWDYDPWRHEEFDGRPNRGDTALCRTRRETHEESKRGAIQARHRCKMLDQLDTGDVLMAAQRDRFSHTTEDRTRALARALKAGRKPNLTPHQIMEVLYRKENGEAVREIARGRNVHNSTISRL